MLVLQAARPVDFYLRLSYVFCMQTIGLIILLLSGQPSADSGFITVRSNFPGMAVYLDGDYLGRIPIEKQSVSPGSYILSIVSNDSLENLYDALRNGTIPDRLSAVWALGSIDAGTKKIEIKPRVLTDVSIDYGAVLGAPTKAKALTCCGIGGIFGLGAIIGVVIGRIIF